MAAPVTGSPTPPAATRLGASRLTRPRLLLGVLLVAISVVVGTRTFAAMDDTVEVWSLESSAAMGSPVTPDDLTVTRVRFADPDLAEHYLLADNAVPDGVVLAHDMAAGDLLARSAITDGVDARMGELPLSVPVGSLPTDLAPGQHVDVWVAPDEQTGGAGVAHRALTDVVVLSVDTRALGTGGVEARVLVGLDDSARPGLNRTIAEVVGGTVVLVRRQAVGSS